MAPPKKSQTKMSLGSFLQDETLGSWADEMEDMPVPSSDSRTGYGGRSAGAAGGLGSYADRGYSVREQLPLPDKPPYTAHLGNLSFDVTDGEIQDFFAACEVTNVRIVEDKLDRKPKGFGYVEFGSVDGLKKALDLNGSQFSGRNIRISVAEPPKDRDSTRDFGDWSRKGPLPDLPGQRRVTSDRGFAPRNFDNASDAGSDRGDRGDRRRSPFNQDDGKVRDFGNWERKGPLQPAAGPPPSRDGGRSRLNDGPQDRKQSPAWGGSQEGSRPPRQERTPIERAPTAPELDNQWRSKMRPDQPAKSPTPSRDTSTPSSPAASAAPLAAAKPASRPKLNLQKRTVSEADSSLQATSATDSKASPFGAARPIDTQTREKEIEEKRQQALLQKKEEDKAKEEKKRQAKEAAKAEKAAAGEKDKENGAAPAGKNYEILRKTANGDEGEDIEEEEEEEEEGAQNGETIDDKSVKPKEVVGETPKSQVAWRGKPNNSTTDSLEADGWSTVSKAKNNRKSGNPATRAIAS